MKLCALLGVNEHWKFDMTIRKKHEEKLRHQNKKIKECAAIVSGVILEDGQVLEGVKDFEIHGCTVEIQVKVKAVPFGEIMLEGFRSSKEEDA